MMNYIYGFVTMGIMVVTVDIIDGNVPNNLWYYIDLYLPF